VANGILTSDWTRHAEVVQQTAAGESRIASSTSTNPEEQRNEWH